MSKAFPWLAGLSWNQSNDKGLVWESVQQTIHKASQYEEFVEALCKKHKYLKLLQRIVALSTDEAEIDTLANSTVNIAVDLAYCLPLLQIAMEDTLETTNGTTPATIFTKKNLAARMFACLSHKTCGLFLLSRLSPLFERLANTDLSTEEKRLAEVEEWCKRLVSPEEDSICLLPRGIRTICHCVWIKAKTLPSKFSPQLRDALVGHLFVHHVLLPALSDMGQYKQQQQLEFTPRPFKPPKSNSSISAGSDHEVDTGLGDDQVATVHLVMERLKEMIDLEKANSTQKQTIQTLVKTLTTDQESQAKGEVAWPETFHATAPKDVSFTDLCPWDLARLHLCVSGLADSVMGGHSNKGSSSTTSIVGLSELFAILRDCPVVESKGRPQSARTPTTIHSVVSLLPHNTTSSASDPSENTAVSKRKGGSSFDLYAGSSLRPSAPSRGFWNLSSRNHLRSKGQTTFDIRDENPSLNLFDVKEALFINSAKKRSGLSISLVVRRLDSRILTTPSYFVSHLTSILNKVQQQSQDSYVDLIIDFTHSFVAGEILLRLLLSLPRLLFPIFEVDAVSMIRRVFVLQPNQLYKMMKFCLRNSFSSKAELFEIGAWKLLRDIWGTPWPLPDDSICIPGGWWVWRLFADTKQRRCLKITTDSIIEFDSTTIVSEVLVHCVDQIAVDASTIAIDFSVEEHTNTSPTATRRRDMKNKTHVFKCATSELAEAIANQIILTVVNLTRKQDRRTFSSFSVLKQNRKGKLQARTLTVTPDCLLNLNGHALLSSLPLIDVDEVRVEDCDDAIHVIAGEGEKEYIFVNSNNEDALFYTLRETLRVFRNNQQRLAAVANTEAAQLLLDQFAAEAIIELELEMRDRGKIEEESEGGSSVDGLVVVA